MGGLAPGGIGKAGAILEPGSPATPAPGRVLGVRMVFRGEVVRPGERRPYCCGGVNMGPTR